MNHKLMRGDLLIQLRNVEFFIKLVEGNSLSSATRSSFTSAKHAAQLSWHFVYTFKLLNVVKVENHNYYYSSTELGKTIYEELVKIKELTKEVIVHEHKLDFTNYIYTEQ